MLLLTLKAYLMDNIPTKAKILYGAAMFERVQAHMLRKSPYFPDFYYEEIEDQHHFSCIVRKEHSGKWYARHHWYNGIGEKDDHLKQFLKNVYLDMMFGTIHPEIRDMRGRPLDPVDDLQQSESERLLGVKG